MDHIATCKIQNYKTLKKKKSSVPSVGQNGFCHDIKAQSIKNKIFIKSKNACSVKDTIKRMKKTNHRMAGNIFTTCFHQRMVFRKQ